MLRRHSFFVCTLSKKPTTLPRLGLQRRFCASAGASGAGCSNASSSGFVSGGPFGSVFRFLGLTAAFAIGSFTLIIVSWPILDAVALPLLFVRAIRRGGDQFRSEATLRCEIDPLNSANLHEYDKLQVENLTEMLFPNRIVPSLSDDEGKSTISMKSAMREDSSIVILCGPPGSNKSELAKRVVQNTQQKQEGVDEKNHPQQQHDRAVLYINLRGYVDPATFLHGTLTYLLIPSIGLLGSLVHAYIKLVNAGVDVLTMNNGHEHNSFIFFAMTMGHVRHSLFAIKEKQQKKLNREGNNLNDSYYVRPLVIIDHAEQFIHNQHLYGKNAVVNLMAQMMMTFLVRAAVDEKICNLLIVADNSVLTEKYQLSSTLASNGASGEHGSVAISINNSKSNDNSNNSYYANRFNNSASYDDFLARNNNNNNSSISNSSSSRINHGADLSSISNCDLLACFPILDQRAKLAYALPRRNFEQLKKFHHSNSKSSSNDEKTATNSTATMMLRDEVSRKLLNRISSTTSTNANPVPPLLVSLIASLIQKSTVSQGCAIDAATLAETLSQEHDLIANCLEALEFHGLVERVAGTSLLFPSDDEAVFKSNNIHHNTSSLRAVAPAFTGTETLLRIRNEVFGAVSVELRIPIQNKKMYNSEETSHKKFFSSPSEKSADKAEAELEKNTVHSNQNVFNSSIVYKKVEVTLREALNKDLLLEKLSLAAVGAMTGETETEVRKNHSRIELWNGIVLNRRGHEGSAGNNSHNESDATVMLSTTEEFAREIQNLRHGEIVTPLLLPRTSTNENNNIKNSQRAFLLNNNNVEKPADASAVSTLGVVSFALTGVVITLLGIDSVLSRR